ncbi:MAG: hypothetical protein AUJ25_01780 [Parcubacteria group bacterium CG1_02_37_13]|nr:MAG: hypothetical protein AUJ25_01780 [Parcubacteria group bacterium CG1_02_37_13]
MFRNNKQDKKTRQGFLCCHLDNQGFTFVEALVAMFVLVSGLLIFLQVFPLSYSVEKANEMKTQAVFLAQEKAEELLATAYQDIPVGDFSEAPLPLPFNLFSRQTEIDYVNSNLENIGVDIGLKKIRVVVSWQAAIAISPKQVEIITLATNR